MTWVIPDAWPFALLALAAWRSFRILCCDTIFDRPRAYLVSRAGEKFESFILCPYCAGFWIAVAWYMLWWWEPQPTLAIASIFALSAAVVALEVWLDRD